MESTYSLLNTVARLNVFAQVRPLSRIQVLVQVQFLPLAVEQQSGHNELQFSDNHSAISTSLPNSKAHNY